MPCAHCGSTKGLHAREGVQGLQGMRRAAEEACSHPREILKETGEGGGEVDDEEGVGGGGGGADAGGVIAGAVRGSDDAEVVVDVQQDEGESGQREGGKGRGRAEAGKDGGGEQGRGGRGAVGISGHLEAILEGLKESNQTLNSNGYEAAISVFSKRDAYQDVLFLWDHMLARGVKPTYVATELVLDVCAEHKLYAQGAAAAAHTLTEGMHVDRRIYLKVMKICLNIKEYSIAKQLFHEMRAGGIEPGRKTHLCFFEACALSQDADSALCELTRVREMRKRPPSTDILNLVIQACVDAGRDSEAETVIRELNQRNAMKQAQARAQDKLEHENCPERDSATVSVDTAFTLHGFPKDKWKASSGEGAGEENEEEEEEEAEVEDEDPGVNCEDEVPTYVMPSSISEVKMY